MYRQHRKRHTIEKYKRKIGQDVAGFMFDRFSPDLNFAPVTFAFNLNIALNIDIDINVIIPPPVKAKYGYAKYGLDQYDPLAPIGILIPNSLTKYLYTYMIKYFMQPNFRGYKYSMPISIKYLNASGEMFKTFAPNPVWLPRFRKIESWRMWTSFYNLAFYNVNIYPPDDVFIRVTDDPDFFGYTPHERSTLDDPLSSNLYDHGCYDCSFYPGDVDPYPEIILLADNIQCYEPLYNVANYGFDAYFDSVVFNPNVLVDIMTEFRQTQQPAYRQLIWLTGSERMKVMYTVHGSYQGDIRALVERVLGNDISSPLQLAKYNAFALEYPYARQFMQLVDAEAVITKYIRLGLSETLLRRIAASVRR